MKRSPPPNSRWRGTIAKTSEQSQRSSRRLTDTQHNKSTDNSRASPCSEAVPSVLEMHTYHFGSVPINNNSGDLIRGRNDVCRARGCGDAQNPGDTKEPQDPDLCQGIRKQNLKTLRDDRDGYGHTIGSRMMSGTDPMGTAHHSTLFLLFRPTDVGCDGVLQKNFFFDTTLLV
ncbi:hypothetical protein Tco_0762438 [Tanacetum coccineum]